MRAANRSRRGFTLVEIIVVISMIGFIMAMVVDSLRNFVRPSNADVADRMKAALIYAHRSAIIHNLTVVFEIDIEKETYTVYKLIREESGIKKKKILGTTLPSYSKVLDVMDLRGIKHDSGIINIPFTHDGVSEDYSIHLGDEYGVKRSVILFRYGGKVVVKNGAVSRIAGGAGEHVKLKTENGEEESF